MSSSKEIASCGLFLEKEVRVRSLPLIRVSCRYPRGAPLDTQRLAFKER